MYWENKDTNKHKLTLTLVYIVVNNSIYYIGQNYWNNFYV